MVLLIFSFPRSREDPLGARSVVPIQMSVPTYRFRSLMVCLWVVRSPLITMRSTADMDRVLDKSIQTLSGVGEVAILLEMRIAALRTFHHDRTPSERTLE